MLYCVMVQFPCAAAALVFFSSLHTAVAQWDTLCPGASGKWGAWNESRCDSATQTCCPSGFSPSGVGCCPFKNAVCCPGSQFACCPEGSTCKLAAGSGYDSRYNCTPADPSLPVTINAATCKGGPIQPLSATQKNVVWIGDSLSLGMMPHVAQNLSDIALVQHAPWGGDGGAEETTYGLRCLANYLHSPSGMPLNKLDLVLFNFGMVRLLYSPQGQRPPQAHTRTRSYALSFSSRTLPPSTTGPCSTIHFRDKMPLPTTTKRSWAK